VTRKQQLTYTSLYSSGTVDKFNQQYTKYQTKNREP